MYCVAIKFKRTEWVEQWICIKFCVKIEHSSMGTTAMIQKAAAVGNWWLAASSWQCAPAHASCLVQSFLAKHQITQVTQPLYIPNLVPCGFWFSPKLKSLLKGKRFQTINEIQENSTRQLMVIGRIVGGPKVTALKGIKVSLFYVQCFLYLVFSSINVSSFHSVQLDTFWADLVLFFIVPTDDTF